jgi:hypothetical protein
MISETESFKVDLELILAQESAECDYGKNALKSKVVVELLGCTVHTPPSSLHRSPLTIILYYVHAFVTRRRPRPHIL